MKVLNPIPPLPDLVLRVGFAGNRQLPGDTGPLDRALDRVLSTVADELATILSAAPEPLDFKPITRFYSANAPCLRLVTGLAEGGDAHATAALDRLTERFSGRTAASNGKPPVLRLRTELAAITPFSIGTYRESRAASFHESFDRRYAQCSYVLELDGIYAAKVEGEDSLAAKRRRRAYRAQSAMLLRHVDILVAAADLAAAGKPGGTLETINAALAFELPVVVIGLGASQGVWLVEPGADFQAVLDTDPIPEGDRAQRLAQWVRRITADPDVVPEVLAPGSAKAIAWLEQHKRSEQPVVDFFTDFEQPPLNAKGARVKTWRERVWSLFEKHFAHLPGPRSDSKLPPFDDYRDRATSLNYHYSGVYRGAFVINYTLAVGAVFLAALSLALISVSAAHHGKASPADHRAEAAVAPGDVLPAAHDAGGAAARAGHGWRNALLGLALGKFLFLAVILYNTHNANRKESSDRAIDYRYLAERLRTMYYLPRLGSFQPPSAVPPKYASRHVRQSGIDWLFDAIVRSVSPALFKVASEPPIPGLSVPTLQIDVGTQLREIERNWIGEVLDSKATPATAGKGQILYHQRNSDTHEHMHKSLEKWVSRFNLTVLALVALDILVTVMGWDPHHAVTVWIIFPAAVLPAAVASLNGLRFQSECQRLTDRSAVMVELLKDRAVQAAAFQARLVEASKHPADALGSYSVEALKLTESVAQELVEEVAEWSVLYSKSVTDT